MFFDDFNFDKCLRVSHCDMDGLMPVILDRYFGLLFSKTISTNYGDDLELESVKSGLYEFVVYTDFTPSDCVKKAIEEQNMKVIIFDHHIAVNEEILNWSKIYNNIYYLFDNDRCGTKIYYDYLIDNGCESNSVVEEIVDLVNVYDLYNQESELWENAFKLNTLMYCTGKYWEKTDKFKCFEFFMNTVLWKMQNAKHFFFNNLETSKINADIAKANSLFENLINNAKCEISTRKDSKGFYFAVFHCNSKVSDICSKMLKKYSKLSYVCCINNYDKDNPRISLRSKEGFDLTELKYVKGHANASGVAVEEVGDIKDFIAKLENKEIYELGYKESMK